MNRTANSTNTQKINYAQAAAQPKTKQVSQQHQNPYHQNQQQQQQQQPQQQIAVSSPNNSTSSVNGKPISQQKSQPHTNSTLGNGNAGRSAPENKMAQQKNPVILPAKGQHWETNTLIQFGSINQPPTNSPLPSSPVQPPLISGGSHPPPLPKSGTPTFGTVTTRSSEELVQPTPTQPAVASSGPGAVTGAPRIASRIQNEIPRTHSAPPQLNLQDSINVKNVGQSSHQPIPVPPHRTQPVPNVQQLSAASSHQQPTPPTSNPSPHHRKDSISSNDGQQIQPYHPHQPHQPQPHHNNHNPPNQQHAHTQYHPHTSRPHSHLKPSGGMGPGPVQGVQQQQYHRSRDKNGHPHTSAQQTVATQAQMAMAGQPTLPMQLGYFRPPPPYDLYYYQPQMYTYVTAQRPGVQHTHIPTAYIPTQSKSKAVPIINPMDKTVVKPTPPPVTKPIPPGNSIIKKDETPVSVSADVKRHDDADKEKENHILDTDKKESKAVPIVNPVEKEREQKEREEKERREREEKERFEKEEKERKEREERERIERIEREERERKEREEKERKEREEKERKEREEKERIEREERERIERIEKEERERKEREERERKEREEKERKEREERERIERIEREERERKEREEKERKEREEIERKEREEKERKEREERERIEKEEKERKEREEREEKERKEREEEAERLRKEKEEKERQAREEQERLEKARLEKEEQERQAAEKKRIEEETVKAEAEEAEKKKETELTKDTKKEEKKFGKGNKPGPLDLSLSRTASAPALGSALLSARIIEDLTSVSYPPNIQSPNPTLNANSEPGKFKYDRGFLMQFMTVCKDKPDNLPALDAIGMEETKDDKKRNSRTGNSRPTQHSKGSPNQTTQYTQMGEFKFTPKTSEERFLASTNTSTRSISSTGSFGGRSTLGSRTGSGSTLLPPMTNIPQSPGRTSGPRRGMDKHGKKGIHQSQQGQNMGQEPVPPLEMTENRWVPVSVSNQHIKSTDDFIPMETVQRKVKALLNKLTLEKFDSISDQIIDYANKSRDEREGRILKEVIRLTFEKSCDEPNFSQMYAQLCRKMMERIDVDIIDENVKNNEGKHVQGGTLFRKYLLNRCQEDFEKGWKVNVPLPSNEVGEPDLMSDEYYTAAKAKRHGLGLIRFIGELFKLNMLTERIMHECIKKLLTVSGNPETPEEEEMESLCKLLTTVGQQLDHSKAKTHMDTYFNRMEDISRNPKISSRIRFMLQDVIELRNNDWIPRRDNNAPKTIAEIHEDAAKQKEDEFMRRTASSGGRGMPKMADQMTRVGSGRRDHRGDKNSSGGQPLNDGWSTVSSSSSRKAGDLSKFGSVSRSKVSGPISLAPSGGSVAFTGGSKGWKTENKDREDKASSMARTNSTSNLYSVLTHADTERKSFEGPTDSPKAPPPTERKKIILQPRSTTIQETIVAPKPTTTTPSPPQPSLIPEEVLERKINNMIAEYFNVLDIQEVILCVKDLPKEYHSKVVSSFANKVLEKKQDDVRKVIEMFERVIEERVLSKKEFTDGLAVTIEFLIDIGADAPKSYTFTGQLLFTAQFDLKEVAEILKPLLYDVKGTEKVVAGYIEEWKREIDEQSIARKVKESGFDFKLIFPDSDINKFLESLGLEALKK